MPLIIALLKTLTLKKLIVLLSGQWHYLLERHLKLVKTSKYTAFITIEASNRCMLQCPECATGSGELTRTKGDLTFKRYQKIIDEVYPYTTVLNLYMQGEPYINKSLGKMIAYAKEKNIFVSISTNAQVIPNWDKEQLPHHFIVSADGASQESYEKYRVGGELEKVIEFCKGLRDYKKKEGLQLPYVELQFLVNRYNSDEVLTTKSLFKGLYQRFTKKSMQIIHPEEGEHFLPPTSTCHRYIDTTQSKAACYKMISTTVLTQDGSLVPCCMDKDALFSYGNINTNSVAQANQSKENEKFHSMTIHKKQALSICRNCPFA